MNKLSKESQLGYRGKKKKPKEGSKVEAPVQKALDDHIKRLSLDSFRVPDRFWKLVNAPWNSKTFVPHVKRFISEAFAGWPDRTVFYPITDKYMLAFPVECKSATGGYNGTKQRDMGERMNYTIPRSPQEAVDCIKTYCDDAEEIKKKLELVKGLSIEELKNRLNQN